MQNGVGTIENSAHTSVTLYHGTLPAEEGYLDIQTSMPYDEVEVPSDFRFFSHSPELGYGNATHDNAEEWLDYLAQTIRVYETEETADFCSLFIARVGAVNIVIEIY